MKKMRKMQSISITRLDTTSNNTTGQMMNSNFFCNSKCSCSNRCLSNNIRDPRPVVRESRLRKRLGQRVQEKKRRNFHINYNSKNNRIAWFPTTSFSSSFSFCKSSRSILRMLTQTLYSRSLWLSSSNQWIYLRASSREDPALPLQVSENRLVQRSDSQLLS